MEIPILARSNTPSFSIEIDGTFTEGIVAIKICLIQHFEADFLWKVSLKILNSGLILKTLFKSPTVIESDT